MRLAFLHIYSYHAFMAKTTPITPAATYRAIVGRLLVNHRTSQKLEQQDLAAAVGVTQSTWSRIETGASSLSLDQLKRACDRLKILPADLLRQADDATARLSRQGVSIVTTPNEPAESTLAFLGGAALAALILSAVAKK